MLSLYFVLCVLIFIYSSDIYELLVTFSIVCLFFYFEKAPTSAQNTPCNDAQRKREETNAKQREYRAKKKAEANKVISPLIFTSQTPLSQTELLAK